MFMFCAEHLHAVCVRPCRSCRSFRSGQGGCGGTSGTTCGTASKPPGGEEIEHHLFLAPIRFSPIEPPRQTLSHAKLRAGGAEIRQNARRSVSFWRACRKNYNVKQLTHCHLMDGDAVHSVSPYVHRSIDCWTGISVCRRIGPGRAEPD